MIRVWLEQKMKGLLEMEDQEDYRERQENKRWSSRGGLSAHPVWTSPGNGKF